MPYTCSSLQYELQIIILDDCLPTDSSLGCPLLHSAMQDCWQVLSAPHSEFHGSLLLYIWFPCPVYLSVPASTGSSKPGQISSFWNLIPFPPSKKNPLHLPWTHLDSSLSVSVVQLLALYLIYFIPPPASMWPDRWKLLNETPWFAQWIPWVSLVLL